MNHTHPHRRPARLGFAAMILAGTAATLLACGSEETASGAAAQPEQHSRPGNCISGGAYPDSPTIDQLNLLLRKGLDPNVPSAEKIPLVQGLAGDPDLLTRAGSALQGAGFTSDIHDVTDYCNGTANADATLTISGQVTEAQVPLVAEEGVWKLDKNWACGLVASLQQTSPICA
jgi:hypothetical protein